MPVAIPEELVEVRPKAVRMGWFTTVHKSTLYQGPKDAPFYTYRESEDAQNIRVLFWAGTFTDADFAYHVCRLMRGDASSLPGALRGNGGSMTLEEAEAPGPRWESKSQREAARAEEERASRRDALRRSLKSRSRGGSETAEEDDRDRLRRRLRHDRLLG